MDYKKPGIHTRHTHAGLNRNEATGARGMGIYTRHRISVGLEDTEDITADFHNSLDKIDV